MAKFLIVAQENGIHVRSSLQVNLCFYCFMVGLPCSHSDATLQPFVLGPLPQTRVPEISESQKVVGEADQRR